MAGHVLYEKRMWDWALAGLVDVRDQSPEHNALIEVFLLHSRVLTEFFRATPKRDDVVASDYVPEWVPGGDVEFLVKALNATNKRWGHLSIYRLDTAQVASDLKRWSDNAHHLSMAWELFLGKLSLERRKWFEPRRAPSVVNRSAP